MGFQTCRVAHTTRFKRSPSSRRLTDSRKRDSASPPAAPFNSTSVLIRQQSQHREERESSTFSFDGFDQYGSNSKNMIACCSYATNNHDQDCDYQSQAQHPVIIGMSTLQPGDHFDVHLQMQGLRITDSPQGKYVTHVLDPHQRHHSSNGASSAAGRELEDLALAVHEKGLEIFTHRRLQSFTDDNFDILEANASAMALDEILHDDLRASFSDIRI